MDRGRALRSTVEMLSPRQVESLTGSAEFRALEAGRASPERRRLHRECRAGSPALAELLAFLYALAPPKAAATCCTTCWRSSGGGGRGTHPPRCWTIWWPARAWAAAARLEALADEDLRRWWWSRCSTARCGGRARRARRGRRLRVHALAVWRAGSPGRSPAPRRSRSARWFTHHSEVDIRHAEQGLDDLDAYAALRHERGSDDDRRDDPAGERVLERYFASCRDPAGSGDEARLRHDLRARIPFVEAFRHAAKERSCSDSVMVRVRDDAGPKGSARAPRGPT